MLWVYTASHCPGNRRTQHLVAKLSQHRPHFPIQVVNLDDTAAEQPSFVIGTPTFVWDNRVLFLGNPHERELLALVDQLHEPEST